jgi:hypothetical protein
MKYLKLYNESNTNSDYQKISRTEYSSLVFGEENAHDHKYLLWLEDNPIKWQDFTDYELEEIYKVTGERLRYDREEGWNYKVLGIGKVPNELCKVVKLDDEWFIVEINKRAFREGDKYFKCDQLHGLLDFLKSIKLEHHLKNYQI